MVRSLQWRLRASGFAIDSSVRKPAFIVHKERSRILTADTGTGTGSINQVDRGHVSIIGDEIGYR